jgi:hypothetical protein
MPDILDFGNMNTASHKIKVKMGTVCSTHKYSRNVYKIFGKLNRSGHFEDSGVRCTGDDLKVFVHQIGYEDLDWINQAHYCARWRAFVYIVMVLQVAS